MRINKFLSERGLCSRREADSWVEKGRVSINGVTATLGTRVQPGDSVRVDGRMVGEEAAHVYIALHKPVGIECTADPRVPHNVIDFVGHREKIFPIGRLDKKSEGRFAADQRRRHRERSFARESRSREGVHRDGR